MVYGSVMKLRKFDSAAVEDGPDIPMLFRVLFAGLISGFLTAEYG
jgi:hypothetical protein